MRVALIIRCSTANALCQPPRRTLGRAAAPQEFQRTALVCPNRPWRGSCWSAHALASLWRGSLAMRSPGPIGHGGRPTNGG
jgi:hypothetical protein